MNKMLFDFNDILLMPEIISHINSRKEISVLDDNGMLPIFTAPMDTVVNEDNAGEFVKNKIYSIIPRGLNQKDYSLTNRMWYSYGLEDFERLFLFQTATNHMYPMYALLDVANGHMKKVYELAKAAKKKYNKNLVLMVGNIANPKTYEEFAKIKVDYVRCGIGGGSGCLTSVQTGVGYPLASLIVDIRDIKNEGGYKTKIIADGGLKTFADINKALALGADYVMLGGMLNKAYESAGKLFYYAKQEGLMCEKSGSDLYYEYTGSAATPQELISDGIYKKYRGMSTKEVQREWGKLVIKTSEGISKFNKVEYTLPQWVENMQDYLKSCMSYCGSANLHEFIGQVDYNIITQHSFNRFNK